MGISGIFKESSYKQEIADLKNQISELSSIIDKMGRENIQNRESLEISIQTLTAQKSNLEANISNCKDLISSLEYEIAQKKKLISSLDDEYAIQELGLYKPRFAFASSTDYKDALDQIRSEEKICIKNGTAANGKIAWTVNGSSSKGSKMIKDMQKLLLRAFNTEADELIDKVKYTNFDISLKRLYASADTLSKLGAVAGGVSITQKYIELKARELRLAFEFALKKQEEKEAQRELRAQEREAAKVQKELAEQRKAIYKEQSHYERALSSIKKQLESDPTNQDLIAKQDSILEELNKIEKSLDDIDYREANQRAGYVYVISNIGAFGENVYKIGMTRRLDPQERIDELGDASVPFNFDIHAMIFSDDAPALEAALHKAFENRKVNMVNTRREFFNVSLDEIKSVIKKNFDKTVEFTDIADAEQYRISLQIKAMLNS